MIVLIPAYEPDDRLVQLVEAIVSGEASLKVVVVDDGSGPAYSSIFEAAQCLGAEVVGHDSNHGKGYTPQARIRTHRRALSRTRRGLCGLRRTAHAD